MKEIVWRLATTLDLYRLATGDDSPSEETLSRLEAKFSSELKKPRPWGMVVHEGEISDFVFSRTSQVDLPVQRNQIDHAAHNSDCDITLAGRVEYMKRLLILSKPWISSERVLSAKGMTFVLRCECRQATCSHVDKKLKREMVKVMNEKPFLMNSDALGNRKNGFTK